MARIKKPSDDASPGSEVQVETQPPPLVQPLDPEQVALDSAMRENEALALSHLIGQLAGAHGSSVTVYRAEKNQAMKYMFQCAPENFSIDELRDKHRGGEFRVYIMRNGQLWKNQRLVIDKPEPEVIAVPLMAPSGGGGGPGQASELAVLASAIKEQSALLMRLLDRPAPSGDLAGMLTAVAGVFTQLKQAADPPAPPPPAPPGDGNKAIEMLLKGVELARTLGGASGEGAGPLDLLRDLITSPLVAQAVKSVSEPAAHTVSVSRPRAAVPIKPPPVAPIRDAPPAGGLMQGLEMLAVLAEQGGSPDDAASLALDYAPPALLDTLLERSDSDLIEYLVTMHPRLGPHRTWCEQTVALIRASELTDGLGSGTSEPSVDSLLTNARNVGSPGDSAPDRTGMDGPPS